MERLHTNYTKNETKDQFENKRKELIYNNKYNLNYNNNYNQNNQNNDNNQLVTQFINYPTQTRETDINKSISQLKNSSTQNHEYHPIQREFINHINNTQTIDPKQIYIQNKDNSKHELLKNQMTIIPNTQLDINNTDFQNSYNNNNELYIAEIGEKRKLSNIIYNSLIKSHQEYQIMKEDEILDIIKSLNIDNWNKDVTVKFVSKLKDILQNKKQNNNNRGLVTKINNTQNNIQNNSINDNINNNISDNINNYNDNLFEKETKTIDYYVTIDSNDRYLKTWENPNHYQIIFEPNTILNEEYTGFINKAFHNVVSVELLEAIIPKISNEGTDYETLPYLLLKIEELGHTYQGTNDYTSQIFAQLIFDKVVGNYRYCSLSDNRKIKKIFNPRISLNKFTIEFLKPNGELYDFGKPIDINGNQIIPNNILTFKITTIQRELNTMYLNQKN